MFVAVLVAPCSSSPSAESVGRDNAIVAAATATAMDDSPAMLERLGTPDSLQITPDEVERPTLQFESRSYHDL